MFCKSEVYAASGYLAYMDEYATWSLRHMSKGAKVDIEKHKHFNIFIERNKEDRKGKKERKKEREKEKRKRKRE